MFPVWEVAYIVACFSPFMSKVMSVFPSPPVLKSSCFPASVVWIFTFGTTFPCLSTIVTWKVVSPFCSGFIILRGSSSIAVRPRTLAPDANGIFEVVEHMPEFPDGGMSALMEYLKKNIKYPEAAMKKGTQGRVTVQFVVEKDGSIANAKVLRGVDPELDKEAVRVVSVMPKWKPGTQKGEAVRVKYTVPVMFRLTEDNTQVKYAPIENKIDEMVVVGYAPEETTYPEEVTVFEVVEKMPEYPGGMSAMMAFISKNIKYPVAAQKAKIQGRVVIQFIVDKEGNIICPRVIRGADPLLDAEAIRLTTIMPKWKPGMQRGQAVNVKYTVPIMFRLQEPEKNPAVQNATVTPTK